MTSEPIPPRPADPREAGLEHVKAMPFGTVFTADGNGRRLHGQQRLMRTGGGYHFVNSMGTPVNAFDVDLASIRDVVTPPDGTDR